MFLQTTAIDCLAGLVANPTLCAKHSQPVYIHNVNKKLKGRLRIYGTAYFLLLVGFIFIRVDSLFKQMSENRRLTRQLLLQDHFDNTETICM